MGKNYGLIRLLHINDLKTICFAFLLLGQLLNNSTMKIISFLSLGELLMAPLLLLFFFSLLYGELRVKKSELFLILLISIFFYSSIFGLIGGEGSDSIKYIGTVMAQCFVCFAVIIFWRPDWEYVFFYVLVWMSLIMGVINILNAYLPGFDLFAARELIARELYGVPIAVRRVVSFTDIFGQFLYLFLLGSFIMMDKVYAVQKYGFMLTIVIVLFSFLTVLSTQSRGGLLAYLLGLVIYFFIRFRWSYKIVLVLFSFFVVFVYGSVFFDHLVSIKINTYENRIYSFLDSVDIIYENPFGLGFRGFQNLTGSDIILHNTVLDAFVSNGFVGGMVFLTVIVLPFIVFITQKKRAYVENYAGLMAGYASVVLMINGYNALTEYSVLFVPIIVLLIFFDARYKELNIV